MCTIHLIVCTTVLLLHVVLGSRRVAVGGLEGSRGRRKSLTQEKQQEDLYKSRACGSRDVEIPFDSRRSSSARGLDADAGENYTVRVLSEYEYMQCGAVYCCPLVW